ncbi:MAG: hypothetical protein ABSE63_18985 [Thermoguttaceae bacterium]|jgi:arginine repressor
MAKKQKVNKTQAVRDYLKDHPKAMSGEIAAALNKKGTKITPSHVANIKTKFNKARTAKKAAKKKMAPEPTAPVEKAANSVTVEQVKAVTQTIKAIGGFDRLNELLGLIREVGGLRRFKDLLDAMQ